VLSYGSETGFDVPLSEQLGEGIIGVLFQEVYRQGQILFDSRLLFVKI
jgi:hypothetical protein